MCGGFRCSGDAEKSLVSDKLFALHRTVLYGALLLQLVRYASAEHNHIGYVTILYVTVV